MKKWMVFLMLSFSAVLFAADQPNVVIFYADDFGWGDLRCHNERPEHFRYTPHMDRIFSEGIELSNYMTHSLCSPSRAGLLTGRHYVDMDAGPRTGGTLPLDVRNIAKDFQAVGYRTGAFGKWHNSYPPMPEGGNGRMVEFGQEAEHNELHGQKTLDLDNHIYDNFKKVKWGTGVNSYGFDRWVGYYNGGSDLFDRYCPWYKEVDWWHDLKYRDDEEGYTTDLITKYAIEFIEQNKERPFFCYIPHEAVHSPVQLKRSDLKEFCEKLDTELGIKGQWEFVSNIKSPTSGRRLGDVEQIRCEKGEEFDQTRIDPKKEHFVHLTYAAYIYSMDKSIGKVLEKIEQIGKTKETLFVFASDNGATSKGINLPFQGYKSSLWAGGVHVPAAIWWPGTFDRHTAPYAQNGNTYDGLISYLDLYPTVMAMTGQPCLADQLDGFDCWKHLRERTECRPDPLNDAIHWTWMVEGALRTKEWKLKYSESRNQVELYAVQNDVAEKQNVANEHPEVCRTLIENYRSWAAGKNAALSWMTIDPANQIVSDAAPEGEVLEVTARQTAAIHKPDLDGVFVSFATGSGWGEEYDAYIHAGDRVEFDVYVCEDSDIVKGCFYSAGVGADPLFNAENAVNQNGVVLSDLELPKGVWVRQTVGVGNMCPATLANNFIALQSKEPGNYHFYFDNIVVRKKDGGVRMVIWKSGSDTSSLGFQHGKKKYSPLEKAKAAGDFPFDDIQFSTVDWK